jgi:prevent-host-death family protein
MPTVSIRDLGRNPSAVVDAVAASGEPALVTKNGKPVAAVIPINEKALLDWVLATAGDPPLGQSLELTPDEVLRSARPIPDFGRRRIPGLTQNEADRFWTAINEA